MPKISEQGGRSLEQFFSQGLSGVTKQKTVDTDYAKVFRDPTHLYPPHDLKGRESIKELLRWDGLEDSVLAMLADQLSVHDGGSSPAQYGEVVHQLAQALRNEAKKYTEGSQEYKIFQNAALVAEQVDRGYQQYKQGASALVSA